MAAKKKPGFIPHDSASGETAAGKSYIPDLGPVTKDDPPPTMGSCAPFLLQAHPDRWTIFGDSVVPSFARFTLQPGVNGISDLGGRLRAGDARNMSEEGGWIIIPVGTIPDAHATPGQPKSYLYQPVGRPDVTLTIYERCYPGNDVIEPDTERYVEFCEHLFDEGIVPRPKLYALRKLLDKLIHERDSFADRAQQNAAYKAALGVASKHVAVVEAAIAERVNETAKPAPRAGPPRLDAEGLT